MGVTAAIVSGVSAVSSHRKQRKAERSARREQKTAQDKQTAKEQAQLAESRRKEFRKERVRRAQLIQQGENLGVAGSSGVLGATSSIGTQTGAALGFQSGQGAAADSITETLQRAANFQGDAANAGADFGLAVNLFTASLPAVGGTGTPPTGGGGGAPGGGSIGVDFSSPDFDIPGANNLFKF